MCVQNDINHLFREYDPEKENAEKQTDRQTDRRADAINPTLTATGGKLKKYRKILIPRLSRYVNL